MAAVMQHPRHEGLPAVAAVLLLAALCAPAPGRAQQPGYLSAASSPPPLPTPEPDGRTAVHADSGSALVAALADPAVTLVVIMTDIIVSEGNWSPFPAPLRLERNVTVQGDSPSRSDWRVVDWRYQKDRIEVAAGAYLTFRNLVFDNVRSVRHFSFPGFDMMAASPPPGPGERLPAVVCEDIAIIQRTCLPANQPSSSSAPRPEDLPGVQRTTPTVSQEGCRNGSSVRPMDRCWPRMGRYDDLASFAIMPDAFQRPVRAGWLLWVKESNYICDTQMTSECAALGLVICFNMMFPNVTFTQATPTPEATTEAPAVADGSRSDGLSAGALAGIVVGSVIGGALVLRAVAAVGMVLTWRRAQHASAAAATAAAAAGDAFKGFETGAVAASSVATSRGGWDDTAAHSSRMQYQQYEAPSSVHSNRRTVSQPGGGSRTLGGLGGHMQRLIADLAGAGSGLASSYVSHSHTIMTTQPGDSSGKGGGAVTLQVDVVYLPEAAPHPPPAAPDTATDPCATAGTPGVDALASALDLESLLLTPFTPLRPDLNLDIMTRKQPSGMLSTTPAFLESIQAYPNPASPDTAAAAPRTPPSPAAPGQARGASNGGNRGGGLGAFVAAAAVAAEAKGAGGSKPGSPAGGAGGGAGGGGRGGACAGGGGGAVGPQKPIDGEDQVVLKRRLLGKGAYGKVYEGRYRGEPVAVKVLETDELLTPPLPAQAMMSGTNAELLAWGTQETIYESGSEAALPPPHAAHSAAGPAPPSLGHPSSQPSPAEAAHTKLVESFRHEVNVLGRCQHPGIVRLIAASLTPPRLCLVLELMEGSLEDLIFGSQIHSQPHGVGERGILLPLPTVLHIAAQILSALAYLHPTAVHRDIKPANVLINHKDSPFPLAKLSDFGLSRLRATVAPTLAPQAGTAVYTAPELFDVENAIVTHHADMYSWAVLTWVMLTGLRPWQGHGLIGVAYQVSVLKSRLPLLPPALPEERCPPRLAALIGACWDADPFRRPAAAEAYKEVQALAAEYGSVSGAGGLRQQHAVPASVLLASRGAAGGH